MKTMRLITTTHCLRNCEGCCNKDHDICGLPIVTDEDYSRHDAVMISGGEPLLFPLRLYHLLMDLKQWHPDLKTVVYGSSYTTGWAVDILTDVLDGLTWTVHEPEDIMDLLALDNIVNDKGLSLRLNVFSNVDITGLDLKAGWCIKSGIEWIKDCPVPEDKIVRLKDFWYPEK
jgi:hypothetical protein